MNTVTGWKLQIMTVRGLRVSVSQAIPPDEVFAEVSIENPNAVEKAVASGTLKWDGCLNLTPACPMHFCEPANVDAFADAVKQVWLLAPEVWRAQW